MKKDEIFNIICISFICIILIGCGEKGISGKVILPNNVPIEDVTVKIEKSNYEVKTDKKGNYLINYPPGTFRIIYSKDKFEYRDLELNITEKVMFSAENIILYPIVDENDLYDREYYDKHFKEHSRGKPLKRLIPKDEWEVIIKMEQLKNISTNINNAKDDMIVSLFARTQNPKELSEYREKIINEGKNKIIKLGKIIDIGKIIATSFEDYYAVIFLTEVKREEKTMETEFVQVGLYKDIKLVGDFWFFD